jgi:hypothetical protein
MGFYQRHLVVKGAEEVKDKNTTLADVQINAMLHTIFQELPAFQTSWGRARRSTLAAYFF